MFVAVRRDKMTEMFTVDEPIAEVIRRAVEDGGELAGATRPRRHFPLIADNANARRCVRVIASSAQMTPDPLETPLASEEPA